MKKNRLTNILRLGVFLFGISLLLWNCEKTEEITTNSDLQNKTSTFSKISLDDFLEENNVTKREVGFKNKKDLSKFNKKTSEPSFKINSKKVVSYINKKGKTIYILPLKKDVKDSLHIYNLVVKKVEGNLEKYIYKYPRDKSKPIEISRIGETSEHKSSSNTHRKGSTCETYHNYRVIPCPCVGHLDPFKCLCPIRPEWIYLNSYQVCTVDNTNPVIEEPDSGVDLDDDTNILFFDNGCRRNREGISECPPEEDNLDDPITPFEPLPMLTTDDIDGFDDFTFSDTLGLTDEQQDWINDERNERNKEAKDAITDYLNSFVFTPEFENAKDFAFQSILALFTNNWMTINDIDFEEQIINELTGKEKCAYDKLKELSLFKSTIKKFENSDVYNLILKSWTKDACNNGSEDGCTDANDLINGNITIYIQNPLRGTLDVAASILHEGIHAEIFKYVDEYKKGLDSNDRPNLLNHYFQYKAQNDNTLLTSTAQHQHMADKYVKPIAQALRKLDNNKYPLNDYMGLAWDGLRRYGWDGYYDNGNWVTLDRKQSIGNINKVLDNTDFNDNCN